MTVKDLLYDMDAPNREVSIACTIVSGDTVNIPHDHKILYVGSPTVSSCTFTPNIAIGATKIPLKADIYGNSYPLAGYTGGMVALAVVPGSGVTIAATAATIWCKSAK